MIGFGGNKMPLGIVAGDQWQMPVDPVAEALLGRGRSAAPTPEPFVWGQGGAKLSPQQVAMLRQQGEGLAASDYSPVGHWTQGLGRVVDSIDGGLKMKRAEKMEAENREYQTSMNEALASGNVTDEMLAQVLMSDRAGQGAQAYAGMEYQRRNAPQKTAAPHYWETNDGSLGMVDPATGKPSILYQDPTAKTTWITADNPDGTKSLIPMTQGGGGQASTGPQPGAVEDGYRFKGGDPADQSNWEEVASSNAGGTF